MVNIQSPTAEIRRGKKREEERNYRMKIYMVSLLHRATIMNLSIPFPFWVAAEQKGGQVEVSISLAFLYWVRG